MEKALSSETVVNGYKARAFYPVYCMILHAFTACLVFPAISLLSQARQLQGAAPAGRHAFPDATISLSLAKGTACLSGCMGWKDKYGRVVRPTDSDEESVTVARKGGHAGKG